MIKYITHTFLLVSLCFSLLQVSAQERISLAGEWMVRLDTEKTERPVHLPGTLDDAGIGTANKLTADKLEKEIVTKLTRKHTYTGKAWYSRTVVIPENWARHDIRLFLERVIWKTQVWIDGKEVAGVNESLSVPHRFDLTGLLKPGKHQLLICIDNSKQYEVSHRGMGHAYTDGTQIIWNGIIGKIELIAKNKLHVDAVRAYPDLADRSVKVTAVLQNNLGRTIKSNLQVQVWGNKKMITTRKVEIVLPVGSSTQDIAILLGKNALLWDEFNPHLYTVSVKLSASNAVMADKVSTTFGMREVTTKNGAIEINGKRIFLRGTLECDIFPLTGHPPMDKTGWLKVFNTAKKYGLNHLRFHSWCPPEAAFAVADSLGFYLQVELPFWNENVGEDKRTIPFLHAEAKRISEEYGNHPSFCLWSLGNELRGDFSLLKNLLLEMRARDKRHIYTTTTFTFEKNHGKWPEKEDEFFVTQYTDKGWVRGQGIFNTYPPDFSTDYTKAIEELTVPVITHEIGQYSVYPNLEEIKKYTGVLDPLNFKAVQHDLQRKHMLEMAPAFTQASGRFSANLYKEEIERALKTKGLSGFQLLDLHDFPGQGTATVGILDAFWDSKGLVTPEEHRMYCAPVVPLIRFQKAVYSNTERFKATAEIVNFSNNVLRNASPAWLIKDQQGKVIFKGQLKSRDIPLGNGIDLGTIDVDLKAFTKATVLTIEVALEGTAYKNRWKVWVYPEHVEPVNNQVVFTTSLKEALIYLEEGKNVLLNPDTSMIKGVTGRFAPVFWSPIHFPDQPGTMGLLCDPKHPALRNFPTDFYSDWQWWDLITSSKTMVLDAVPDVNPVVRIIDNFFRNRKMGDIIEARVGKGKLILVSANISTGLEQRPAARQLRYSLEQYMAGKEFLPGTEIKAEQLRQLVKAE
jgi:hypothetical protein